MKTAVTINDQTVNVPSSWHEVSYAQFLAITKATTDAETLAALSGIDLELCEQIQPNLIAAILQPSSEMGEPEQVHNPLIFGKPVSDAIGTLEYARKVNCDALHGKHEDGVMLGRMVAIYCAEGIEDKDIEAAYDALMDEPFLSVYSAATLLSNQLVELQKGEKLIKQPEYESEEFSAGIHDFKKYGVFGLVRSIALKHHCTIEDVFKWSYNSVLLELQISADENAYQRKLNKILSRKK